MANDLGISPALDRAIDALRALNYAAEADAVEALRKSNAANFLQIRQREGEAMDAAVNESRALDRIRLLERTGREFVLTVDGRDNEITAAEMAFRAALNGTLKDQQHGG